MKGTLYFDYNATHPPIQELLKECLEIYVSNPANSSGISALSQENQRRIESSREQIAGSLSTKSTQKILPSNLTFVSTGTEALHQMVRTYARPQTRALLSPYEHEAMIAACKEANLSIDMIRADKSGVVDPDEVNRLITPEHSFVSVLAVSNETGAIQPVSSISEITRRKGIPFLCDCIQAAGKLEIDYALFDAFCVNGHKFGAGFGTAVLASRKEPVALFGGGLQEDERRAGTENLFSILCTASALEMQTALLAEKNERLRRFQKKIEESILEKTSGELTAAGSPRATNTSYFVFPELENIDFLFLGLDQKKVVVSTGSSCKSRTRQPSRSLQAMGYSKQDSMRAVRISTGLFTTEQEVDEFLAAFFYSIQAAS